MPAEPQQISGSAISRSSRPGMPRSSARGWARTPWACAEVAGVVVGDGHRQRVPLGDRAQLGEQLGEVAHASRRRPRRARRTPGRRASRAPYSFSDEPQPAALTTMASIPAPRTCRSAARRTAAPRPRRPLCTHSAPQQPCPRGITTSQPSAASTRAVAALTSGKNAPWTQPVSMPDHGRRVAARGDRARQPGTAAAAAGRARPSPAAAAAAGPAAGARDDLRQPAGLVGRSGAAQRPQPPRVGEQREDRRAQRPLRAAAAACRRSTCARVCSISRSYCTPDGQAVTQAMQPRHASKCPTIVGVSGSPSSACCIRWIRPRGESISSPHSTYVGQVGRQNPQCTQSR